MGTAIRLSEATELFEVWRRSNKFSENTIVNDGEALRLLMRVTGDIQVRNINERHFDLLFL